MLLFPPPCLEPWLTTPRKSRGEKEPGAQMDLATYETHAYICTWGIVEIPSP
jgi:hypothetical protein